jgi:hypothetical protein
MLDKAKGHKYAGGAMSHPKEREAPKAHTTALLRQSTHPRNDQVAQKTHKSQLVKQGHNLLPTFLGRGSGSRKDEEFPQHQRHEKRMATSRAH